MVCGFDLTSVAFLGPFFTQTILIGYRLPAMDLRLAVHEFVSQGRELLQRLRSSEGDMLKRTELHILQVQLYLLHEEVTKRKHITSSSDPLRTIEESQSQVEFPPFESKDHPCDG